MKKPEAGMAIQMLPKTKENTDAKTVEIVDHVIAHLKASGLNVFVGPFETTVDGPFDQLMQLQKECFEICIEKGAYSVAGYIKIYFTPGEGVLSIAEKVDKHHQ